MYGLGGTALAVPFLRHSARAGGEAGSRPKRFVVLSSPYGHPRDAWFPADEGRDFELVSARARRTSLESIPGDPSAAFERATWGGLLDQALLLEGIDGGGSIGHTKTTPLTGWAAESLETLAAPSIDQMIADKAGLYPAPAAFPSIHVAVGPEGQTHGGDGLSYVLQPAGATVQPEIRDPAALWQLALQSLVVEGGEEEFEALRARRLRVTDRVLESYKDLRADARLSAAERVRLDQYLEHLDGLQLAIDAAEYGGCVPGAEPDTAYADNEDMMARAPFQLVDVIAQALKCDVTRVATISLGASSLTYRNLGVSGHHHALTHQYEHWNPGGWLTDIARYHGSIVASLLAQLDEVEDHATGRTYLDNSVVLWTSDMGTAFNHWGIGMPAAIFGAKGWLDRGALIDFRSHDHSMSFDGRNALLGVNYGGVLVSICQAFGLEPEDYEYGQVGIGAYGFNGTMAGTFGGDAPYTAFAHGDKRNPLPEIFV